MTVRDFINQVLIAQYKQLLQIGLHYISFGLIALGIEFLGACLDQQEHACTQVVQMIDNQSLTHQKLTSGFLKVT